MERSLLHDGIGIQDDERLTLIGDVFKQLLASPRLFVHPAGQRDEFG